VDLIHVSAAMSLDGHIDDGTPQRLLLSSPEDFADVDQARAECDAILVGAETVRRDNPSLVLRDPALVEARRLRGEAPEPTKVTVTTSGDLDPAANFFRAGRAPKLVVCPVAIDAALRQRLGGAAEVVPLESVTPATVVRALAERGIRRLFVEGGATVLTAFLSAGAFHRLRLAIAPFFVGDDQAPRLVRAASFPHDAAHRLRVTRARVLGDVTVIDLVNDDVASFC
jgi:5-amino-6-(5-phosphoribosylamino)uracil reductase